MGKKWSRERNGGGREESMFGEESGRGYGIV